MGLMGMGQNPDSLLFTQEIAGKWMVIPPQMAMSTADS